MRWAVIEKVASYDFYPRPLRGGRRPPSGGASSCWNYFYPRPLRGGRPLQCITDGCSGGHFYPRPLRGGRRLFIKTYGIAEQFLSTPSARRATVDMEDETLAVLFLSTPSARRATRKTGIPAFNFLLFLSTPSARRATQYLGVSERCRVISIHALCEEGDPQLAAYTHNQLNFYPRPLRGGRPPASEHP